jgi:two-component system OmpR family response regulator
VFGMTAAAVHGLDAAARRRTPDGAAESAVPPAAVQVTVHISISGDVLPPAAIGLLDSLRALAARGLVEPAPDDLYDPPVRPRLVRSVPSPASPELVVALAARSVHRDGAPVRLTRREFDLFAFLVEHPRRVFTRRQLLRQVWGYEPVSGERTVDVHVRRLRIKLGGGPSAVVATVRGVGYRLAETARVRLADPEP